MSRSPSLNYLILIPLGLNFFAVSPHFEGHVMSFSTILILVRVGLERTDSQPTSHQINVGVETLLYLFRHWLNLVNNGSSKLENSGRATIFVSKV